jgi:hypothetical protein
MIDFSFGFEFCLDFGFSPSFTKLIGFWKLFVLGGMIGGCGVVSSLFKRWFGFGLMVFLAGVTCGGARISPIFSCFLGWGTLGVVELSLCFFLTIALTHFLETKPFTIIPLEHNNFHAQLWFLSTQPTQQLPHAITILMSAIQSKFKLKILHTDNLKDRYGEPERGRE